MNGVVALRTPRQGTGCPRVWSLLARLLHVGAHLACSCVDVPRINAIGWGFAIWDLDPLIRVMILPHQDGEFLAAECYTYRSNGTGVPYRGISRLRQPAVGHITVRDASQRCWLAKGFRKSSI